MSIDAMKQALEALNEVTGWQWAGPMRVMDEVEDAITSLRQAIAEAEKQEPLVNRLDWWALIDENQRLRAQLKFNTAPVHASDISQERVDETAKREHEVVADNKWKSVVIVFNDDPPSTGHTYVGNILNRWSKDFDVYLDGIKGQIYTAPPKREWVGLTDEEMFNALLSIDAETKRLPTGLKQFAKATETKLREKNGG